MTVRQARPRNKVWLAGVMGAGGLVAMLELLLWAPDVEAQPRLKSPRIVVVSMPGSGNPAVDAYARTCSYCHDHGVGPDLRAAAPPPEAVIMFVRKGFGPMPAFRPSEIGNADLSALAKMIAARQLPSVMR